MDSPERVAEEAWIHRLGPEAETLFAHGMEPVPFMRRELVDPIVTLLRAGQSVVLVGPEGVGKRSLALSLRRSDAWSDEAQPTLPFDVPAAHPNSWPVYCTTTRNWIAGSFYVGNLENRIDMMLRRVRKPAVILFESVHQAIGAWQGRGDNIDLADLLIPVVTNPLLRMIVTTTPRGWAQLCESKADLAAQFMVVDVPPPSDSEARVITALELARHDVDPSTAAEAIAEAFALAAGHFGVQPPLGPALRLLRGALAIPGGGVGISAIRGACAAQLGLLRCWVGRDLVPSASTTLERLNQTVLGQHEACAAVVDDLIASVYGLTPSDRPRSYVFAGAPGIGKTSLACALQAVLGGPDSEPLRFDCTELVSPSDTVRLLTTSEPDSLVVGLLERPGAVVILDEIDRAHPFVRGLLYQLLEGRVTTSQGELVSSANATVIMTTNAGSAPWMRIGMDEEQKEAARAVTMRACAEVLGRAITSRVTRLLVFPPLTPATGRAIVELELQRLAAKPELLQRGVSVNATPRLIEALAHSGMSNASGARGVQKAIHLAVAIPVARLINEQNLRRSHLQLDALTCDEELQGVRIDIERWN
jgi:ATP-dependent Clp protease ATP-binding subunit ClpA